MRSIASVGNSRFHVLVRLDDTGAQRAEADLHHVFTIAYLTTLFMQESQQMREKAKDFASALREEIQDAVRRAGEQSSPSKK